MKALPKANELPKRTSIDKPKEWHYLKHKTMIVIFPRITEWLKRKELMQQNKIYDVPYTNIIYWIKKQNRYMIVRGHFDEDMLNLAEERVKSVDWGNHHFINNGMFVTTL